MSPRFVKSQREMEGRFEDVWVLVDEDDDLDLRAWVRDAFALSLPGQITCTPECRGLCPVCGAKFNEDPEHAHEAEPDPRWAKLSEIKFE